MTLLAAPPRAPRTTIDLLGTRRTYDDQGRLHDQDGPAVQDPDGYVESWDHGVLTAVVPAPATAA